MDTPKDKPQIFPNPYNSYCDTYLCSNQAKHFIGRADGPLNLCMNLCDDCLDSILTHIPDAMRQQVPPPEGYALAPIAPEGYTMVKNDYYNELQAKAGEFDALEAERVAVQNFKPESSPEKFYCDSPGCGRTFGTKNALTAHQRVHKDG